MADLPPDVRETLDHPFGAAATAVRERHTAESLSAVESARTVTAHARRRTRESTPSRVRPRGGTMAADEPLVAAEYCRAMRDRIGEE